MDVGDIATLTLTVTPFDGTTAVAVQATSPTGTISAPSASTADSGATWTALLPLTTAGAWQVRWTVTGTGSGVQRDTVYAFNPTDLTGSYASLSDLAAHLGDVPPDYAATLLVRASRRVDTALVGAWYAVDDAGLPTDTTVAAALRDATVTQVGWWIEQGDTTGSGVATEWVSVQIGKVSMSRAGGRSGVAPMPRLAPDAAEILQLARLIPISPWMVG